MLEYLILSAIDEQAISREWRKPVAACEAPAPSDSRRLSLHNGWTVITTATGYTDAWCGDVPLLLNGVLSSDLNSQLILAARTPSPRF